MPLLDEDYLILSTIHSAKGQEWKAVHVLNVVDGCIPSDLGTGSTHELEEERRLLYVAMTRAKDELHLIVPQRFYVHNQSAARRQARLCAAHAVHHARHARAFRGHHVAGGEAAARWARSRPARRASMSAPRCAACGPPSEAGAAVDRRRPRASGSGRSGSIPAQPFGSGPAATAAAIEHLGYVQIDTINVIERCHHHILFSRIPGYRRSDLAHAQSVDKSVFEYWTHALAYVPIARLPLLPAPHAAASGATRSAGARRVDRKDYRRVIRTIRDGGPITIRDIEDEVLVEKEHLWASRKPSKGALQRAFWDGVLTTSARTGMLRTYELTDRHFGWDTLPKPATERQIVELPARYRDPRPGHRQHRLRSSTSAPMSGRR